MGNTYKTYDPNEDYKKKMDEAAAKGDYASAARYEQQRNDKIKGEGLTQYQPTSQYAQYLPENQHTGYTPYDPSGSVAQAQQMLNQAMAQKPGAYKSTWQGQMDQLMEQILNRKPFEYDMNSDAMYQQLRDQYMEQGSLAMEDAMGKAATLTGGYGNSYANVAGHQAYQGYMDKLNDRVPELYQMSLDRYLAEGQGMMDKYSLMAAGDERDYGRYQDTLSRYYTDFGLAQDQYNDERSWQYQLGRDQIEDERYMQQLQMSQENDQRNQAYELAMSMLQSGMMPSETVLDASGLSAEDAQKIYDQANISTYTGDGGSKYDADTAKTQQMLVDAGYNITVDGVWGPETQKAYDDYNKGGGGGTLSDAGKNFMQKLPYPYAGSDIDVWRTVVAERVVAAYNNGVITASDLELITIQLGL